jgi:hypothetical protein
MTTFTYAAPPGSGADDVDRVVHHLIDLHLAGEIDDKTARREICGALYAAGIHHDVAGRRTDLSPQTRSDLADRLLHLLVEKLTDGSFYSLKTGRTRSACGWARQVARTALPSELRNQARASVRNGTPVDPTTHTFSAVVDRVSALKTLDPQSAQYDAVVSELVEDHARRTRGMREGERVHASAQTLCLGLGVPAAVRPERLADRDHCRAALAGDETLAHRSLRTWRAIVLGVGQPDADVDDQLLALWDDQTEDSSAALLAHSARVTHLLALAAVSPLPLPPAKVRQRLRDAVAAAADLADPQWGELATALVDSYEAAEFEACSSYATLSEQARRAALDHHRRARARLDDVLARVAAHPAAPYGTTPQEVLATVARTAEAVRSGRLPTTRLRRSELDRAA